MEVFVHASSCMLILFVIIGLGFWARKKGYLNNEVDAGLSSVVMKITLPAMLLDSVLSNPNLPDNDVIFMMLGYSTLSYIFVSIVAVVFVKVFFRGCSSSTRGTYMFVYAYGNTAFIGFPVLSGIMGSNAVLYGAIYSIPFNFFMFSVGMLFVILGGSSESGKKVSLKDQLKVIGRQLLSPVLIACFISMLLAIGHVTDDGVVGTFCGLLGQMTVPAAMLIVGSSLAKMPLREMVTDARSYLAAAGRLIVAPLSVYFVFGLFVSNPYILAVLTILCAMPVATVGTMICIAYGGDSRAMARCTFLTTVLSLVTLPLLAVLVV